jgi:hypothetical protein
LTAIAAGDHRWQPGLSVDHCHRKCYNYPKQALGCGGIPGADDNLEVENDHQDWDQAVDGIRTTERQLERCEVRRDE